MSMKVNNKQVIGHGMLPSFIKKTDIDVLKAKEGVSSGDLEEAAKHNGLDEIAFKTENGDLYVAVADELNIKGRLGLAKPGDKIQVGDLEGTVVFSDNEINKGRLALGLAAGTVVAMPLSSAAVMAATLEGANLLTALPLSIVGVLRAYLAMGAVGVAGSVATGTAAAMGGQAPEGLAALTDHVATLTPDQQ